MNEEIFKNFFEIGYLSAENNKYIWFPDMEFLSYIGRNERKSILQQSHKVDNMTVFAVNGRGDCWAWDNDNCVFFIELGSGNCKLYALSFIDAVFRQVLEYGAGITVELCTDFEKANLSEDDAEYYCSETECKNKISECKNAFGKYFSDEENMILTELLNADLENQNALISFEKFRKVISDLLNCQSEEPINILK